MPQTRAQSGVPPKRTERFYSTPQRRSGRNRPWASPEAQQAGLDESDSSSDSSITAPKSKRRKKGRGKATPGDRRDSAGSFASVISGSSSKTSEGSLAPDSKGPVDGHANGIIDPDRHSTTMQHGPANGNSQGGLYSKHLPVEPDNSRKVIKDPRIDYSGHFEFGGSSGVSAMMVGFPAVMYYMWIGATYYDGSFPWPTKGQTTSEFLAHLQNLVYVGAYPSLQAWIMYWSFVIYGGLCYIFLPGIWVKGKRLEHDGGRQLDYYCSGLWSFYFTIIIMATLHFTGVFKLYTIIDEFGPILSVAIISGYIVSSIAYFSALYRGAQHRMSGSFLYDFFMGAELNPRMFGILDFKMFFEVRLPWYILLMVTAATAARQYENYGYISGEVAFLLMAHFLYANACSKGEECIVTTWDIYYEKWGFMLIFWNLAGVPLSYCHCTLYLANHPPSEYRWNRYALASLFVIYLFIYWIWDTTNSQKNRFRQQERGTLVERNTFPQLPWQTVKNPKFIKTSTGDAILVDGWYGYARKIHYTCDLFFALSWGLVTGFRSPFPWFYPVFFTAMITHRAIRDIQRCKAKYGASWDEYSRRVPYLFIPGVI